MVTLWKNLASFIHLVCHWLTAWRQLEAIGGLAAGLGGGGVVVGGSNDRTGYLQPWSWQELHIIIIIMIIISGKGDLVGGGGWGGGREDMNTLRA